MKKGYRTGVRSLRIGGGRGIPVGQATAKSGESGNQLICNWEGQFLRIASAGMWIDLSLFFVVGRPVDGFLITLFLGSDPSDKLNLISRENYLKSIFPLVRA